MPSAEVAVDCKLLEEWQVVGDSSGIADSPNDFPVLRIEEVLNLRKGHLQALGISPGARREGAQPRKLSAGIESLRLRRLLRARMALVRDFDKVRG